MIVTNALDKTRKQKMQATERRKKEKKKKGKIMVLIFFCQAINFVPKNNSHFEIQFH